MALGARRGVCPAWGHLLRETSFDYLAEGVPTLPARCSHSPIFSVYLFQSTFLVSAVIFCLCLLVCSLSECLLGAYNVPGSVLGPQDTEVKEQISCPPGVYGPVMVVVVRRQTITRINM